MKQPLSRSNRDEGQKRRCPSRGVYGLGRPEFQGLLGARTVAARLFDKLG
jgi:hypothetical protein